MSEVIDGSRLKPRELAAWRGMLATHSRVTATLDEELEREHGLPLGSYEVLLLLSEAPEMSLRMGALADGLLLSRSGLTRLVDRLEALGYVTRCSSEDDGRGLYAELTDAGAVKLEQARRTHREGVRKIFLERLSATDQAALGDIWTRFQNANGAPHKGRPVH